MMKLVDFKDLFVANQYTKVFKRVEKVLGKFFALEVFTLFLHKVRVVFHFTILTCHLFYNDVSKLAYLFCSVR
jgi:hypothetical protein